MSPESSESRPEEVNRSQAAELLALRYVQGGEATDKEWSRTGDLIDDTGRAVKLRIHLLKDDYIKSLNLQNPAHLTITRQSYEVTMGSLLIEQFDFREGQPVAYRKTEVSDADSSAEPERTADNSAIANLSAELEQLLNA